MFYIASDLVTSTTGTKTSLSATIPLNVSQHGVIVLQGRSAGNIAETCMGLQLNGDTDAKYSWLSVRGQAANPSVPPAVGGGGTDSECRAVVGFAPGPSAGGGLSYGEELSGFTKVFLPNWQEAIYSQLMRAEATEAMSFGVTGIICASFSGYWKGQAPIATVTAILDTGPWAIGSSMRVYGET